MPAVIGGHFSRITDNPSFLSLRGLQSKPWQSVRCDIGYFSDKMMQLPFSVVIARLPGNLCVSIWDASSLFDARAKPATDRFPWLTSSAGNDKLVRASEIRRRSQTCDGQIATVAVRSRNDTEGEIRGFQPARNDAEGELHGYQPACNDTERRNLRFSACPP